MALLMLLPSREVFGLTNSLFSKIELLILQTIARDIRSIPKVGWWWWGGLLQKHSNLL